ncbi:MAG: purine-binding chemotaxis protein CheW [Planctomycetes bacterium]|nr:purine-binding chemotaxis protein CheW [Planctomycetota bacterium]
METQSRIALNIGDRYLSFRIGNELYGVDTLRVQEIIGLVPTTRVPRMPKFIRGVINLRGKVLPIVDIRAKFGLEDVRDTERTCVIVVQTLRDRDLVHIGIVVDEVADVHAIKSDQAEAPPEMGLDIPASFISAVTKVGANTLILLDIETILSKEELSGEAEYAARAKA